jgi:hypothetical protein
MQGTAEFLYGTGIPKTLERMSYGDSLFSGAGMTLRPKEETINAAMNVAPFAPAVGRLASRAVRATEGMPVGMSIKSVGDDIFNLSKQEFLGKPRITKNANAADLKPIELTTLKDVEPQPFMGGKYQIKMNEDGAVVLDKGKPIASYNFGDTLVVDKPYRKSGLAQELVYEWRTTFPAPAVAEERTKASQAIQEKVWERIQNEKRSLTEQSPYPQQAALDLAQQRAAKTGQSLEPYPRSLQQGYEYDWYHGSTGDISNFRQDLLGEATGAQSAKKGFFFARDPQNPPASMMVKTTDPASIDMLKKLGKTDEEIAALNQVSMQGQGAETASGYANIGGSREYREAMRNAKSAEKRGDWNEYEKQMQIAEDFEINRMQEAQSLVAKYGDARDTMTEKVNQTFYSLQHPQAKAELLDKKYKELMPYGWYNSYSDTQFNNLKNEIVKLVGKDDAAQALKEIDKFKSIKNERASLENTQSGGNVMPVALRYKNPMVYDFGGAAYREQTYSDLVDQALRGGHDALILKNTFDPAGGQAKLIDVGVVFSPDQIRSKFAAFDPLRKDVATAIAAGVALPDLLAQPVNQVQPTYETIPTYTDPFGNTIGSSIR